MDSLNSLLQDNKPRTPAPAKLYWTCEKCGVIAPLALPTGRWIERSCECQRQARKAIDYEEQRQAWIAEQKYRTFGGWLGKQWKDAQTIRELSSKTFANYDESRFPDAYNTAWKFAQNPKGNMLLYGTCGGGKTHLEAAICNHLREQNKTSLFVSAPQFFMAYNNAMKIEGRGDQFSIMSQACSSPLLVLDDVDKARPTDARWETYYQIINERLNARRPTILSTNKEEDLDQYIGEAAYSRLSQGMTILEMIGDDYRLEL